jgi:hypothetical protein
MSVFCIHGFRTEECASCRTCPHGLISSRCGRCITAAANAGRKRPAVSTVTPPSHEHAGFEIFYVPAVSGWRYRRPDGEASSLSYRSAFLARKAVDQLKTPAGAGK